MPIVIEWDEYPIFDPKTNQQVSSVRRAIHVLEDGKIVEIPWAAHDKTEGKPDEPADNKGT